MTDTEWALLMWLSQERERSRQTAEALGGGGAGEYHRIRHDVLREVMDTIRDLRSDPE